LVAVGSRNNQLTSFAGRLRAQGKEFEEILENLREHNRNDCAEPPVDSELLSISRSIASYPAGRPKRHRDFETDNPLWWFALSIRYWLGSTEITLMSAEQIGWYMRLKVRAWANRGWLPADPKALCRLAQADPLSAFEDSLEQVLFEYEPRTIDGKQLFVH